MGVLITMYADTLGFGSYSTSIAVVIVLLSLFIARFTNQGRQFWSFFNASKLELAKVVWPSRKETMSISAMVIVAVMIFSVIIAIFGWIFNYFIQYFLG